MRPNPRARILLALCLLAAAGACRNPAEPDPVVGTWLATTFRVTPMGQGEVNVLAEGGTLGFNVANNFVTTGTLVVPPGLNGGTTSTASLAGTAVRTQNTVRFVQQADTFVRDLTFTLVENRLEARDQVVAGTTYDLVLTRQ
jgi:hypothetical protein